MRIQQVRELDLQLRQLYSLIIVRNPQAKGKAKVIRFYHEFNSFKPWDNLQKMALSFVIKTQRLAQLAECIRTCRDCRAVCVVSLRTFLCDVNDIVNIGN